MKIGDIVTKKKEIVLMIDIISFCEVTGLDKSIQTINQVLLTN